MNHTLYAFTALLAMSLISACKKFNRIDSDVAGLANSGFAWPGGRVKVCFLNDPVNKSLKALVPQVLASNFKKSFVGIEFYGFLPCAKSQDAPAKLYFSEGRAYSKYIGTYQITSEMPFDSSGATIVVADSSAEYYAYNTILHEFGHFAGLFHEQSRMENINGDLCSRKEYGGLREIEAQLPGSYPKQLGAFDRMSIMNYCVQGYFSQPLKLSAGDVSALRQLYIPSSKTPPINDPNNPAELCNIVEVIPYEETNGDLESSRVYTPNGRQVSAFVNETFKPEAFAGMLDVGTKLSRLITKPFYTKVGTRAANLTAIQAVPKSGPLANKKVWLLGNVTRVIGCRESSN
jgi:hypothetical protein